ncbi:MAG: c-type cytochrome, partial [Blastocatellia bacterium]
NRQGASEPATGDAAAGALVYQRNGCASCHSINGKGGFLGPDLSDIGAKRAVRHLRQSLLEPNADLPLDYRTVEVISITGKSSSGIHLNEDEYSLHLRDMKGDLRSFMKSEIKEIKLPRESLMPDYKSLSKDELENLVGYLSSLRQKR